jgi:hypothetical protein
MKKAKKHKRTKVEESQARSQSRKNQTILDTEVSGFRRTDRVRAGFEI